jgi:hypothetical protein
VESSQKNENNQDQILDKLIKMHKDIEEIQNLEISNNENENTKRKRSNSFDDIYSKKTTFEEDKRNGRRRRKKNNNDDNWRQNLKYEIVIAARDWKKRVIYTIDYHNSTTLKSPCISKHAYSSYRIRPS